MCFLRFVRILFTPTPPVGTVDGLLLSMVLRFLLVCFLLEAFLSVFNSLLWCMNSMKVFSSLIETFKACGNFKESISLCRSSLNLDTANIIASKAEPSVLSIVFSNNLSQSSGSLIASSTNIFKNISTSPVISLSAFLFLERVFSLSDILFFKKILLRTSLSLENFENELPILID